MIFLKRRRLIFWLIKAYFKKRGKSIIFFFLLGFAVFTLLFLTGPLILSKIAVSNRKVVGIVGAYTFDQMPLTVSSHISLGLTTVSQDGTIHPGLAKSWTIQDNGKKYILDLYNNKYFTDRTNVTSKDINYDFANVKVTRPTTYSIIFTLKDSYAPFLVTLSRPVFKKGLIGVGSYKLADVKINGSFIQTISLSPVNDLYKTTTYKFYPSVDTLKNAYLLGEITEANELADINTGNTTFTSFPNTIVTRTVDYSQLVTLFYNTQDGELSDKRVREALTYALPDTFPKGEREYASYPPNTWYYPTTIDLTKHQDFLHAAKLLDSAGYSTDKPVRLILKTSPQYLTDAKIIQAAWKKLNVQVKIETSDNTPSRFQVYLSPFNLPKDPDQYVLWHTDQPANITAYRNLRIDKLLEDGRKTTDISQRKQFYTDFQKYLIDDQPASFLYFPYTYDVRRK